MNDLSFLPIQDDPMAGYAKPNYQRQDFNRAGKAMRDWLATGNRPPQLDQAFDLIDNWRSSHSFPLNSFTMTLKNRAKKVNQRALLSQRIKRLPSIALKLLDRPEMKLTQMQDIAGCRAVMPTLKEVYDLRDVYRLSPLIHPTAGDWEKDYIADPKDSGYRGIHLKYRFCGRAQSLPYNDLKVEIQIRTLLQHKWATAVEAAGTFTKAALKSNRGSPEWLRFFALMGSVFAIQEACPTVPNTPTDLQTLHDEIRALNRSTRIETALASYRKILPTLSRANGAKYFLVVLDPVTEKVDVFGFKAEESRIANRAYTETEKQLAKDSLTQVVLVSVSSAANLKRAYPNYFLDTEDFLREVRLITGGAS
jgi:hypothetical protein